MRILVTGASGYIGGRLVPLLIADRELSITTTGRRSAQSCWDKTPHVIVDGSFDSYLTACRGIDTVIHLAGMSEPDCERAPEDALICNGLFVANLVRAAERCEVRRIIYLSTSKVFGSNPVGVIDENSLPQPANHYAITHRVAEDYILAAHKLGRLEGIVIRLSNALGPPRDLKTDAWSLISNDLCHQAATSGQIILKSSGLAWRNFIAMEDVVAAIIHCTKLNKEVLGNGLFHLGGLGSLRIIDLARRVAARNEYLFRTSVDISYLPPKSSDFNPELSWRVNKLLRLGWIPKNDLDAEIDAALIMCRGAITEIA